MQCNKAACIAENYGAVWRLPNLNNCTLFVV